MMLWRHWTHHLVNVEPCKCVQVSHTHHPAVHFLNTLIHQVALLMTLVRVRLWGSHKQSPPLPHPPAPLPNPPPQVKQTHGGLEQHAGFTARKNNHRLLHKEFREAESERCHLPVQRSHKVYYRFILTTPHSQFTYYVPGPRYLTKCVSLYR